jgi:sulfhydrogenase subunit beta (sulfur reductase)
MSIRMREPAILTVDGLQALMDALARRGYRVLGPTLGDGAIVYDDIASVDDLPRGWTDSQEAARYRLERRADGALFGYAVGPHSWKRFLHPPTLKLWHVEPEGDGIRVVPEQPPDRPFAFVGVRACELKAMAVHDRVFLGGTHVDMQYKVRREGAFILAVNCGTAGGTCFCVSMQAGPKAAAGYDLALTELIDGEGHRFLLEAGTDLGAGLLAELTLREAPARDVAAAEAVVARTAASMGREMPAEGLKELLLANLEHKRWDDVAARCLTCANCTMVCPTCFCTSVEDGSEISAEPTDAGTSRSRRWDSCFTMDFSYIHGGSVRAGARSRYRQWMTHKLATWFDQFGSSGCVGCGRCITWCPVGIDITQEVAAMRDGDPS